MLRRPNVSCYFCNSAVPLPKDSTNFRCPYCNCLNRWIDGNIVAEEPAMYDESLNTRAFSKRGAQSKDRLPTMFGRPDIFCHTCQTNQMLIVNLLANYLPPAGDPESDRRMQTLDEYRESLYARYPPVCAACDPVVEDEIRRKDAMARTQALGGWLSQTKGKAKQRQVSLTTQEKHKLGKEILAWRIRGLLWATTAIISMLCSASAALGYRPFSSLSWILSGLPFLAFISIFWVAWDPTYSSFRSARIQGRDVRVRGKDKHIALQSLAWTSRLATSIILAAYRSRKMDPLHLSQHPSTRSRLYFSISFIIELCVASILYNLCHVLISLTQGASLSFFFLRLQQPPTIRLIDTTTHRNHSSRVRSETPTPGTPVHSSALEPELFASLSFSSKPVIIQPRAPVFGQPSLQSSHTSEAEQQPDADEMDIDPPANAKGKAKQSGKPLFRPQRFFAPEAPTGLETLLERTKIDDITMGDATFEASRLSGAWNWWWIYASSLLPLGVLAYKVWGR